MKHDIFISYSSEDKIVADAVVAALESRGIRCWYAPRDIEAGRDWGESITNAISESTLMLLIFSENSNKSKRVLDEIYYSISEGKTILPFRIEKLDPSGAMRLHLSSRHWLDAYDPSWEAHINRLIDTAASNLEKEMTLSDDMALISAPPPRTVSTDIPWKLIGIILAVGIVIVSGIGIMKWRGGGAADPLPTATGTIAVTEEIAPTEEPAIPTPTFTAMPTITPTITPTVTSISGPDLSGASLSLEDLPAGFMEMSPAELGFTKEDLSGDDFTVEDLFVFFSADPLEIIVGFTTILPTQLDQVGFDMGLTQPEFLMESFVGGMGATDILEQKELVQLNDIADASVGLTVVANMDGIHMRMDMAVFRRDTVGAVILVMYVDGDVPILTIEEVITKLDDRLVDVITPGG